MNLNKYTEKAQEALLASQSLAETHGQQLIDPEHLLLALLQQDGGIVPPIVQAAGANPQRLTELVEREIRAKPKVSGVVGEVRLSRELSAITDRAE
ncbi:MAG: Clp protease N-terminal domain-containing protein, partial [Anaerolineae bacterium]|nr:Clp protease N-terminal domain-containing protein [Anaerolineae bacterium]